MLIMLRKTGLSETDQWLAAAPLGYALDEHVEDLALVVDRTPQIHPLVGDPHHHLVNRPCSCGF